MEFHGHVKVEEKSIQKAMNYSVSEHHWLYIVFPNGQTKPVVLVKVDCS